MLRTSLIVLALCPALVQAQSMVLTAQYDNDRTAANLNESTLTPLNVNASGFGKLFTRTVDGYLYAQPLFVPNVNIPSSGVHNIVFAATMSNTVYAFDADDPNASTPLWHTSLGPPVPATTAYLPADETSGLAPTSGILATPVIDLSSGTLYAVALVLQGGVGVYQLHALDLVTGAEKSNSPVVIQGSVAGTGPQSQNGILTFNARQHLQRTGLLLSNGKIYFGFGSYGDTDPYQGWIFGYDAATLQQSAIQNLTPAGRGGIWQAGGGLSADSDGFIYVCTGNGEWDGVLNFGESCVKLDPSHGLAVVDYFSPVNYSALSASDEDLGSGRPLLIPRSHYLVVGGKQSLLYLLDTNSLGQVSVGDDNIVQMLTPGGRIFSAFAYLDNPVNPYLYVLGSNNALKRYRFTGASFEPNPTSSTTTIVHYGSGLSVSANGGTAGSGIVWATTPTQNPGFSTFPGTLRAFDASNIAVELWNSDMNAARDALGNFAKFATPTVANGKVYAPTFSNQLAVYGLLPSAALSVSPGAVNLNASGIQLFTANTAVTWTISPSDAGSISPAGLYTAPTLIAGPQTVTVTATGVADPSKSGSATITLIPVTVTVNPATTSLYAAQTQQFIPTVTGSSNTIVSWDISPNVGSISTTGLYTAPAPINVTQSVIVTATSAANPNKSGSATITLSPLVQPSITQQPQDILIFSGQTATFTLAASGPGLTYQWQSMAPGAGAFTSIPGAASSSFTTPAEPISNSGAQFRCVVSNSQGTIFSRAAVLTVQGAGASFVTSQIPGLLRNNYSGWVGMHVTIGASPVSVVSLGRIYVPGNTTTHTLKIVNANTGLDVPGGTVSVNMAAGVAGSFVYGVFPNSVSLNAGGSYYILSQETMGGDQWYDWNSTVQTASVAALSSAVYGVSPPYFETPASTGHMYGPLDFTYIAFNSLTVAPTSVTLSVSQTQQFTATGNGNTAVNWSITPNDAGAISTSGFYAAPASIAASQTVTVTVTATSVADPSKSSTASVTLTPPVSPGITQQPQDKTITAGQTASFTVVAAGPNLTYQWQSMAPGAGVFSPIAGAVSGSFTTAAMALTDSGTQYQCVVSNSLGPVFSRAALLTVQIAGTNLVTSRVLGAARNNYSGWVGMSVTIGASPVTVVSLGRIYAPGNTGTHTLKIVNASTGVDMPGGSAVVSMTGGTAGSFVYGALANAITLNAGASYYILSQEVSGGDQWYDWNTTAQTTGAAALTAAIYGTGSPYTAVGQSTGHMYVPVDFSYLVPVAVTVSPFSSTLFGLQTQLFTASVTGSANMAVSWSITPNDAGAISTGGFYAAPASIAASQTVTVTATSVADPSKSSTASVTLTPPVSPGITQQPQDKTITAGQTASFTVVAAGPNLTYQWQSMAPGAGVFSPIAGAVSSSFTTATMALTDSGTQFQCVVSNSLGPVFSRAALLTVQATAANFVISKILGPSRNNYSGWVGMSVTIGASPVTVVSLGRIHAPGNTGTHTLKIVSASTGVDMPGGSAVVSMTGGTAGSLVYGALPNAITLNAGASYYILSQEVSGGDQWYDWNTTAQTTGAAALTAAIYGTGSPYTAVSQSTGHMYGPVDLSYLVPVAVTNPPPNSGTLPAGLIGRWTFDAADTSGKQTFDKSGNGYTGTISGSVTQTAGILSEALAFSSNGWINMAYASQAELNKSLTLAAWIKTTNSSRNEALVSKYDTQGYGYVLRTTAAGKLELEIGTYNAAVYGNKIATDSTTMNDGQWHHVAVTISLNSNVTFYVDGVLSSVSPLKVTGAGSNYALLLVGQAGYTPVGNYFNGNLDDVQIYNRALSAAEVATVAGH